MHNRLWHLALLLFTLTFGGTAQAEGAVGKKADNAATPAKVMLIGTFHFDNPGLDAVKFKTIDVTQPNEQAYLQALSERVARFKPTRILLEYPREKDAQYNQRYADYLAGQYKLGLNEIDQLGLRIAKLAGLKQVYGFDDRSLPSDNTLWTYLPKEEPQTMSLLETLIANLSARFEHEHRTLSLRDLLIKQNTKEEERVNKDFYMLLNAVGAEKGKFIGADATANWWQRNFRMYATVQTHAQPGERVLVIVGAGHTAILRDLLQIDSRRVEESPLSYF